MNFSKAPLRALCKLLALSTFFFTHQALEAGGVSIEINSGEEKIAFGELLVFNFEKKRESFDYLLFETAQARNVYLKVNTPSNRRYFLDYLSLDCSSGRISQSALSGTGELLDIKKVYPPYTALDFEGNMVADLLCCSDERFWEQKRFMFKPAGDVWVNIDFKKDVKGDYLVVEYSGNFEGEPLIKDSSGKDVGLQKKVEKFKVIEISSFLYGWNGDKWVKLGKIQPVQRGVERRFAFRLSSAYRKFRITIPAGFLKINAVYLATAEKRMTARLKIEELPSSLNVVNKMYHRLNPGDSLNFSFRPPKDGVCILSIKGYFEKVEKENDVPKGIDDIINRFLSRIKFWSE